LSYYYLIAQLPLLRYGQPAPLSPEDFLQKYGQFIDKGDMKQLRACSLGVHTGKPSSSALVSKWQARERTLFFTLAKLRAARSGFPMPKGDFAEDEAVSAQAKAAFAMEDPLQAEHYLDEGRWKALESFLGMEYFGADVVFAYYIKLLLLARRASFDMDVGFAEYKALYAGILENAPKAGASEVTK
jgi:hypothetical protein